MKTRLLLAVLTLAAAGSAAFACLHGATGRESTTVVDGKLRTDRLIVSANGPAVVRVFVAPRGLAPGKGLSGAALGDDEKTLHARLGARAAGIKSEGTRGMSKSMGFAGSPVTGRIETLTDEKDWAAARAKAGLEESPDDSRYEQWFSKVKSSGRGLYALKLSLNGEKNPEIALQVTYTDPRKIVQDKWLEAEAGLGAPSVVFFQGGDAKALASSIEQATGLKAVESQHTPGDFNAGGGFMAPVRVRAFSHESWNGPLVWFADSASR
ncbi:MAG: hypothetical protein HY553_11535 [Elusimicrobia bacterium]|nr:hypothetical protein [Elusimicrobiota bacterium]